jgi:hypothetical protein
MNALARVQISCFFLSYAIALAIEVVRFLRGASRTTRIVSLLFTAAGFVAHTAYLITRSKSMGLPPLLASQQDWLLVLAWMGVFIYLILMLVPTQRAHGIFMLPAVLLLVVVAVFVSNRSGGNLAAVAMKRWGMFHAASLVLGMAAVFGSAISGLMYLLNHQRLRNRSMWLKRLELPNLEDLSAINRWMVVFSVPCLTIGLLTGFLLIAWSPKTVDSVSWSDPTIVTSVAVWIAMVVVLIRILAAPHPTGKSVAMLSLLSGGFLLVTILGPMVLAGSGNLETFHGRVSEALPEDGTSDPARDSDQAKESRP